MDEHIRVTKKALQSDTLLFGYLHDKARLDCGKESSEVKIALFAGSSMSHSDTHSHVWHDLFQKVEIALKDFVPDAAGRQHFDPMSVRMAWNGTRTNTPKDENRILTRG